MDTKNTPQFQFNQRQKIIILMVLLLVLALGSSVLAQDDSRPELDRDSPIALNPAAGREIGFVYEAFLSPLQEGGEEEDTPIYIPAELRSTAPSVPRNERTSRGHGVIEFTNDLSRAYVHLAVENVNPEDVVLLHLHCGRPGQLGPIIIDFGLMGHLPDYLADGQLTIEITNEDIMAAAEHDPHNPLDTFTSGCPIVPDLPHDKIKTLAGMELVAREGELYFNLHTKGQMYFGDIRGQFHLVEGGD